MFSSRKQVISVGQGLLILMDKYQDDPEKLDELRALYLEGVNDQEAAYKMFDVLNDEVLLPYEICEKYKTIDNDPTRRYFESYLAFFNLFQYIQKIRKNDLVACLTSMMKMMSVENRERVKKYAVEIPDAFDDVYLPEMEIRNARLNIESHECFQSFDEVGKGKLRLIVMLCYAALVLNLDTDLPMNIYGEGYYSPRQRGRDTKSEEGQYHVRSCNFGLLKSYMPLRREDVFFDETPSDFVRVADRYRFIKSHGWTKDNFSRCVHPFSASISGTMLILLRALLHLNSRGGIPFDTQEKFGNLIGAFTSFFLLNSGGHSLHEFISPLHIPEVQKQFSFIPGFENINLTSLFLENHEDEFDLAMYTSVMYNKQILNLQSVNAFVSDEVSINWDCVSKLRLIEKLRDIRYSLNELVQGLKLLSETGYSIIGLITQSIAELSRKSGMTLDEQVNDLVDKVTQALNEGLSVITQQGSPAFFYEHKFANMECGKLKHMLAKVSVENLLDPSEVVHGCRMS